MEIIGMIIFGTLTYICAYVIIKGINNFFNSKKD